MSLRFENSIIRIFTSRGTVVGAGFLVSEWSLITCAHVVVTALDLKVCSSEMPTTSISLDFPLVAPRQIFTAQVVFWQPPRSDGSGDIAILQLNDTPPTSAQITNFVTSDDLWEHDFRTFGFPSYHDNGGMGFGANYVPEKQVDG